MAEDQIKLMYHSLDTEDPAELAMCYLMPNMV